MPLSEPKTMDRMIVELAVNQARKDGVNEGLERAAQWHEAMASQLRRYADDYERDVPTSGVFAQQAIQHNFMAQAMRALKETDNGNG